MLSSRKNIKPKIKPKRIFDELAEFGLLEDLIKTRLKNVFEQDKDFKSDMINILYERSQTVIPVVEMLYLENLSEDLSFFLEFTSVCRKQKL